MHHMQTLTVVFRLLYVYLIFFIPVVNIQYVRKQKRWSIRPISLQWRTMLFYYYSFLFKLFIFVIFFYLGHVINMADAAVFEIFVYKNGQINTFMSIYDCLFVQLIPYDKQKQTFVQQFSKCLHPENVRTLSFSLLCEFNFLRICVFRLVGTQYINNSANTRRSHTS